MMKARILISIAMAILSLHLAPPAALGAGQQLGIWTWRNPAPTGNNLYGVTHGYINGHPLSVAVGAESTILTSPDGTNWSLQLAPPPVATLSGVVCGSSNGVPQFVAVGSSDVNGNDVILFSPDGTNWTAAAVPAPDNYGGLFAVAYAPAGAGYFLAVGFDGFNFYSTNGMNWTEGGGLVYGGQGDANGVTYGYIASGSSSPGFVAAADAGVSTITLETLTNTALINWGSWTIPTNPPAGRVLGVTYDGANGFVAVGGGGLLNSSDGVTWYDAPGSGTAVVGGGNNLFVIVGSSEIYTSPGISSGTDPWTWTEYSSSYSFDAIEWLIDSSIFVAVGPNGTIATSSNGTSWNQVSKSVTVNSLNAITYGANAAGVSLFVAGGMTNTTGGPGVFTSPDGYVWTLDADNSLNPVYNSSITNGYINGLAYGNISGTPEFVATVNVSAQLFGGSLIISSSDANTWSIDLTSSLFNILNSVAYGKNASGQPVFVAVGNGGTAESSPDLHTWTRGTGLNTIFNFNAVAYDSPSNNPTFVTVGQGASPSYTGQNTYYSHDGGNTWTAAATGPPSKNSAYNGVAYGNGMFVAVGVTNGVYPPVGVIFVSFDGGTNWTQIPPAFFTTPPAAFSSVTFANGFFVATTLEYGAAGTVWVSPDGANWTPTSIVASGSLHAVASGDYQYIAVGDGGTILGSVLETVAGASFVGGVFSFTAHGPPGMEYGVYVSNDLITWTWLENITIPASSTSMSVSAGTSVNYSQGYYYLGPPGP